MRAPRSALLAAALCAGCGPQPDADCAPMCAAAAAAYGACLGAEPGAKEGGEPRWADAGYDDEQGFLDACDTWAWEQRLLARAAEGRRAGEAKVSAACADRAAALDGAEAPCAAFLAIDWSAPLP